MDEFHLGYYLTEKVIEETIRNGPVHYRPSRLTITPTSGLPREDSLTCLTPRETEVLGLIAKGLSNHQVAHILTISRNTVHAHLYSIYSKLGVGTRTAAARIAFELGL